MFDHLSKYKWTYFPLFPDPSRCGEIDLNLVWSQFSIFFVNKGSHYRLIITLILVTLNAGFLGVSKSEEKCRLENLTLMLGWIIWTYRFPGQKLSKISSFTRFNLISWESFRGLCLMVQVVYLDPVFPQSVDASVRWLLLPSTILTPNQRQLIKILVHIDTSECPFFAQLAFPWNFILPVI